MLSSTFKILTGFLKEDLLNETGQQGEKEEEKEKAEREQIESYSLYQLYSTVDWYMISTHLVEERRGANTKEVSQGSASPKLLLSLINSESVSCQSITRPSYTSSSSAAGYLLTSCSPTGAEDGTTHLRGCLLVTLDTVDGLIISQSVKHDTHIVKSCILPERS